MQTELSVRPRKERRRPVLGQVGPAPPSPVSPPPHLPRPVRVLIADNDRLRCETLERGLTREGYLVVGVAEDGHRAVVLARRRRPRVAVLADALPVMNGLDAAQGILRVVPRACVVLLTEPDEDRVVRQGLGIGVRGFVTKAQGRDDVLRAIRAVSGGALYVSASIAAVVLEIFGRSHWEQGSCLTPREEQVLVLSAQGKIAKQIAALLGISTRTVQAHQASLMGKLKIHDKAGLVRYAIQHRLIRV